MTPVELCFDDGDKIAAFTSFSLFDDYSDPLGRLEFVCAPPRARISEYAKRLRKGERVKLKVNNVSQGNWYIQTVSGSVDESAALFRLTCHTPLVNLYQGNVNPDTALSRNVDAPVADAIALVAADYFETVNIRPDSTSNVDAISGKPRGSRGKSVNVAALKHGDCQGQFGERAYEFIAKIVTRLGCMVRWGADDTIIVGAPDYAQSVSYGVHQTFGKTLVDSDRCVGRVSFNSTNDEQFSECTVYGERPDKKGQTQTSRPKVTVTAAEVLPAPAAYSSTAPFGGHKPLYINDKEARDPERAKSVAKLALGLRARDAFSVECEVDGFISRTGRLWQPDTLARVVVEAWDHDEVMWLKARTFEQDANGQRTKLVFIPKGAFVLGDLPGG